MVSIEMLVALLGSAVAASLITALFAKAQTDKGAIVDNIIKERKAWRDKLRVLVSCTEGFFNKRDSGGLASISPQTLALASLVVAVVVTTTEWVFGLEASLQIGRDLAFWLAGAFFFIAVTANPPRAPFSYKKILYWIANESFREPYRERNDR